MDNPNNKNTDRDNGDNISETGIDIPRNNQSKVTDKTNDKPWLFKKGNSGGPGRPKGKSLKEYSREMLAGMTEEERLEFMEGLPKETIWKMAEGNPPTVIAGDKDNPLRIITVDKDLAKLDGIIIPTTEDDSVRSD